MKNTSKTSLILALTIGALVIGSALSQLSFAGNKNHVKLTAQQKKDRKVQTQANKAAHNAMRAEMKAFKKTLSNSAMSSSVKSKSIKDKKAELRKKYLQAKK